MVNPDGSVDYSKIKSFSAADYSVLLSYAQRLNKDKLNGWNVLLGGNAKIIYRNVGSFANAWGVGIDAGVQAYKKGWYFGVMAKDITTTYTAWSFSFTDKEKEVLVNTGNILPSKSSEITLPRLNMGVARDFDLGKKFNLLTELDWDITTDGMRNTLIKSNVVSIDPKFGVEASYNKLIYLRAGIGNFQKALDDADTTNTKMITTFMPTIGVGVRLKSVCLEYAYTDLGNQSQALYSNVFSLRVDFNSKKKEKAKDVTMPIPEKAPEKTQKF
jgi:hypothetical protein